MNRFCSASSCSLSKHLISPVKISPYLAITLRQTSEQYGVQSYPLYYKSKNLYKTFYTTYQSNKKYVSQFDLLIIGGGGILMDFYRREAHLYSTYALMAKACESPIYRLWLWCWSS